MAAEPPGPDPLPSPGLRGNRSHGGHLSALATTICSYLGHDGIGPRSVGGGDRTGCTNLSWFAMDRSTFSSGPLHFMEHFVPDQDYRITFEKDLSSGKCLRTSDIGVLSYAADSPPLIWSATRPFLADGCRNAYLVTCQELHNQLLIADYGRYFYLLSGATSSHVSHLKGGSAVKGP